MDYESRIYILQRKWLQPTNYLKRSETSFDGSSLEWTVFGQSGCFARGRFGRSKLTSSIRFLKMNVAPSTLYLTGAASLEDERTCKKFWVSIFDDLGILSQALFLKVSDTVAFYP